MDRVRETENYIVFIYYAFPFHSTFCCLVTQSCPTLCNPWTAACQASLIFIISQSLLKLMSVKSFMPSNHLILCRPLLPSSFPASGTVPVSWLFSSGGQSIRASVSASVLVMIIQGWFPLGLTDLISCNLLQSQESSPKQQFKSISSSVLNFLYGPTLTSTHYYWKNHSFD